MPRANVPLKVVPPFPSISVSVTCNVPLKPPAWDDSDEILPDKAASAARGMPTMPHDAGFGQSTGWNSCFTTHLATLWPRTAPCTVDVR